MCGRYNILPQADWSDIYDYLGEVSARQLAVSPARYNITPSEAVPIVIHDRAASPALIDARWGFIPRWWKQNIAPNKTSNARSETAGIKPMWRESWRHQRCLIPATGWYEWFNYDTGTKKPLKIPHLIQTIDEKPFLYAGLWSEYQKAPDQAPIATCTIITIASPPDVAVIHERTPVVLKPDYWKLWLDAGMTDPGAVQQIVREGATNDFKLQPIGPAVSKTINHGPECLEPRTWSELEEQGIVRYSQQQLAELRSCEYKSLVSRLRGNTDANQAEWRLWIRELTDRDDAAQFEGFISEIRDGLKSDKQSQAGLF